jgi:transposase InsO family protein
MEEVQLVDEELRSSMDDFPVNPEQIRRAMTRDKLLMDVVHYTLHHWPKKLSAQEEQRLGPFYTRRQSLSVVDGVLLLQSDSPRVVIPEPLRGRLLELLHRGHFGMVRMKRTARQHCWWPGVDRDMERLVRGCPSCQQVHASPKAEFHSWPAAASPWERIHLDFAGPFWGSVWLVCVDSFSRFPYVAQMSSTTTQATVQALRKVFIIEGLPRTLVTDNGPQFTSSEFTDFCKANGIEHLTTAPFHPASNGLAERFVRTFKESMAKSKLDGQCKLEALQTFLAVYRSTPSGQWDKSPGELLHGRPPRTLLSLIQPSSPPLITQTAGKFKPGDNVQVKFFGRRAKWAPGVVIKRLGKMMYLVETELGQQRRHQNQLRRAQNDGMPDEELPFIDVAADPTPATPSISTGVPPEAQVTPNINLDDPKLIPRRSSRVKKPVDRYGFPKLP